MKPVEWFTQILRNDFHVLVKQHDISHETTKLYVEEVDPNILPADITNDLPEILLFETIVYVDDSGIDWLGVIGMDVETYTWYVNVIVKEGNVVMRELLLL